MLYPIFYGSFDWHSSVHTHWLLARLHRRVLGFGAASEIRASLDGARRPDKAAGELAYLNQPASTRGFERPSGWAWLLLLTELEAHGTDEGQRAQVFATHSQSWLALAAYSIHIGTNTNSAFALMLARRYALAADDRKLAEALDASACRWYGAEAACQAWEPSGTYCLSPALIEAERMRAMLPRNEFGAWFGRCLLNLARGELATLFTPLIISDRSDSLIAHLDELNLIYAARRRGLAAAAPQWLRLRLREAARRHLNAALPNLASLWSFNTAIICSSVNLAHFISPAFVWPHYNPCWSKCAGRNRLTWLANRGSIVVRPNSAAWRFRGEAAEGLGRGGHEAEEASHPADDRGGCPSRAAFKEVPRPADRPLLQRHFAYKSGNSNRRRPKTQWQVTGLATNKDICSQMLLRPGLIERICDESGEMNSGQEVPSELIVSGGDASEVFEPALAALDDISAFVGTLVEAMDDDTVGFAGDYGLGAATSNFSAKALAVIAIVDGERANGWRERQNIGRSSDMCILARGQMKDDRPAERIAQRSDFCRSATARAADRLIVLPPFPPEAQ